MIGGKNKRAKKERSTRMNDRIEKQESKERKKHEKRENKIKRDPANIYSLVHASQINQTAV